MDVLKTYAVINEVTKLVENVVIWDGVSTWAPPEGTFAQLITVSGPGIGWTFENEVFVDKRPKAPYIPDPESSET